METSKGLTGYNGIFAERLRQLMKKENTTQAKLAEELGVSRQAVSTYMDGSVLPNLQNLQKICNFFKVPSDYLLGFTISKSSNIEERHISDIIGLDNVAIDRLKKYRNSNNDNAKNILTIMNIMLICSKPLEQLSDTFLKRFDVSSKLNITRKQLREVKDENFVMKKGVLVNKCDEYSKEVRWFSFLSSEYLDVIFNAYSESLEYLREMKGENGNGNENK